MDTAQRRKLFVETYEKMPIFMVQGSVGERIKRNFTFAPPAPPLKLAGLYYTEDGRRGLETVFRDYTQIAQEYDVPVMLHPYTKTMTAEEKRGLF